MRLWRTTPETLAEAGVALRYWAERDMPLDHQRCFLCGADLESVPRTDEHVFSRWLLRDLDLWNWRLTLPNGTSIPYTKLTIPCCNECNSFWLGAIEARIADAFRVGPAAVAALDETTLCLWMAKIYFGLRFKELVLLHDRRSQDGKTIIGGEDLARMSELHQVLQAVRGQVRFSRPPGSIRVFSAQVPTEPSQRFDFRDLDSLPFLTLRVGATVVVASLLDWGAMKMVEDPYFDVAHQLHLHPMQVREVAAHGAYRAMRFRWRFGHLITRDPSNDVITPIRVGTSEYEQALWPLRPFVAEQMAAVLAEFTGWPIEDIYETNPPGLWSTLLTADGRPLTLPLDSVPADAIMPPSKWLQRNGHAQELKDATIIRL
jgi:hypothetical protein